MRGDLCLFPWAITPQTYLHPKEEEEGKLDPHSFHLAVTPQLQLHLT